MALGSARLERICPLSRMFNAQPGDSLGPNPKAQRGTLWVELQHVGWVERGETHQPNAGIDGFRSSTHPTGLFVRRPLAAVGCPP